VRLPTPEGNHLVVSLAGDLHRRFATLIAELTKFGLIGTLGLIIDIGGADLLHGKAGFGPLIAKAISASAASVISYVGHRLWTFRHRASQSLVRGGLIFFGLNLIGLVISLLVIGFVTDALRLQSLAAYNAAQAVGVLLGMAFRYWSYRRWVFLAFAPGEAALQPEPAALQPAALQPEPAAPGVISQPLAASSGPAPAPGGHSPADRLRAERLRADHLRADHLRAERLRAERLRAERLRADRLRAERLRTDQA
jgi:putative flippase GtrA